MDKTRKAIVTGLLGATPARLALTPYSPQPQEGQRGLLEPYQGGVRERIANALGAGVGGLGGGRYTQQRFSDAARSLVDFVPGLGDALSADDFGRSVDAGDWLGAGINGAALAAGVVPVVGDAAGKAIKAKGDDVAKAGIRAFHGSPHSFDKFDLSKIGTGEGAQAYGHGLYFAENEGIAKSYRETLAGKPTPSSFEYGGVDAWQNYDNLSPEVKRGIGELHARLSPYKDPSSPELIEQTRKGLINTIKNFETGAIPMDQRAYEDAKAALNLIQDGTFRVKPAQTPGSMYEVRINANPDDFLDWDMPLSEQSAKVKGALNNLGVETGQKSKWTVKATAKGDKWTVYDQWGQPSGTFLSKDAAEKKAKEGSLEAGSGGGGLAYTLLGGNRYYSELDKGEASQKLMNAGVPGIKYLDAGSRSGGNGTRNYVVFDDKLIEIVRKYGIVGLLGAGFISQETAEQLREQGYT